MGVPDLFFAKTNLKSRKILYDSNNFDPSLNYKMIDFHGLTICTQTICFYEIEVHLNIRIIKWNKKSST